MTTKAHPNIDPDRVLMELLAVDDVASLLRCSPRHIYRLADAGKMPRPVKLGALVRWRRAEIAQWLADGCQPIFSFPHRKSKI